MKSIYSVAAATSMLLATIVSAGDGNIGCYSSVPGFNFSATIQYNTDGSCKTSCKPGLYGVMATTKGSDCWCGNVVPMPSLKTDNSSCSTPCTGFGDFTCGGPNAWTVYLTGFSNSVSTAADTSTATPSATKSAAPSVVTQPGSTIVVTAGSSVESSASSTASAKSSSSPSKAGIAAGVVVGIVAIAAIAGGIFLFIRNKNRREVEEEYRRNAAVNSFINGGGKPPGSSAGGSSITDTRLDANVMAQRRMSDGSIADNQDYSRRILKVTNA